MSIPTPKKVPGKPKGNSKVFTGKYEAYLELSEGCRSGKFNKKKPTSMRGVYLDIFSIFSFKMVIKAILE